MCLSLIHFAPFYYNQHLFKYHELKICTRVIQNWRTSLSHTLPSTITFSNWLMQYRTRIIWLLCYHLVGLQAFSIWPVLFFKINLNLDILSNQNAPEDVSSYLMELYWHYWLLKKFQFLHAVFCIFSSLTFFRACRIYSRSQRTRQNNSERKSRKLIFISRFLWGRMC